MIIFQSIVLNIKIVQTWYKQQVGELGVPQIFEKAQSVTKNFKMYVYPFLAVKSVSNFEKIDSISVSQRFESPPVFRFPKHHRHSRRRP